MGAKGAVVNKFPVEQLETEPLTPGGDVTLLVDIQQCETFKDCHDARVYLGEFSREAGNDFLSLMGVNGRYSGIRDCARLLSMYSTALNKLAAKMEAKEAENEQIG